MLPHCRVISILAFLVQGKRGSEMAKIEKMLQNKNPIMEKVCGKKKEEYIAHARTHKISILAFSFEVLFPF